MSTEVLREGVCKHCDEIIELSHTVGAEFVWTHNGTRKCYVYAEPLEES